MDQTRSYLDKNDLNKNTNILGKIDHDKLPNYLNKLKLLVIPSYTEGLPNIMLEAMACGTPVLSTPVGGIPDIITDGQNGFIMEDNSPESISKSVENFLEYPDIGRISENAQNTVKKYFNYDTVVKRWSDIFS